MRIPVRSERDAFRLTLGGVVVIAAAVLIGWLTEAVVGAAVFALALALAVIAYLRVADPDRRAGMRKAAHETHLHGAGPGERHVLVIANEVRELERLRRELDVPVTHVVVGEAGAS